MLSSAHCGRASRRRDVTFQPSSLTFLYTTYKGDYNTQCCSEKRDTYPQLRQRLEQVKYSSGKNELLVMCSSGISPLKLSLRAWRQEGMEWQEEPLNQSVLPPLHHRISRSLTVNQASLPAEPCRWRWRSVASGWCCCPAVAPGCAADRWSLWEDCRSEFPGTGWSWKPPGTNPASWNAPGEDARPIQSVCLEMESE